LAFSVKSLNKLRRLRFGSAVDTIATLGTLQIASFELAAFGNLGDMGVARFVQTIFGPVSLVFATMYVDGLWGVGADPARKLRAVNQRAIAIAKALSIASLLIAGAFLVFPTNIGVWLQGETFQNSRTPVLIYALSQLPAAVATGAVFALRAINQLEAAAKIRVAWAFLILAMTPIGASRYGASGFFFSLGIANAIGALIWLRCYNFYANALINDLS
jgi:hypothetical protein